MALAYTARMVATRRFGYLRMFGGRYEQGGLPVAAATELERYEHLLKEVARSIFLQANPARKRTSGRFRELASLYVTGIGNGSVVPVLERAVPDQEQLVDVEDDYIEQARVLINSALRGVRDANKLIPEFPTDCLRELSQLGRSLQEGERFEFGDDADSTPAAILDNGVRLALQNLAHLGTIQVEKQLIGHVSGLRSKPQSFDFLIAEDQRQITGAYVEPSIFEDLQSVIGFGDRAPLVAISAVAEQSASGEVGSVVDVLGVESVLPPEWSSRLGELSELEDGWLEPDSPRPGEVAMRATETLLLTLLDNRIGRPGIYALARGGVQLEWKTESLVLEIELPNVGGFGSYWYSTSSDKEGEGSHVSIDEVAQKVIELLNG